MRLTANGAFGLLGWWVWAKDSCPDLTYQDCFSTWDWDKQGKLTGSFNSLGGGGAGGAQLTTVADHKNVHDACMSNIHYMFARMGTYNVWFSP